MASARRHGAAARPRRTAGRRRAMGGAVSSAVLYLAIVALWAVVLVPMWLRRDNETARPGLSWLPHRRPMSRPEYAAEASVTAPPPPALEAAAHPSPGLGGRRRGRGAVMARRRRRTWGLSLL